MDTERHKKILHICFQIRFCFLDFITGLLSKIDFAITRTVKHIIILVESSPSNK